MKLARKLTLVASSLALFAAGVGLGTVLSPREARADGTGPTFTFNTTKMTSTPAFTLGCTSSTTAPTCTVTAAGSVVMTSGTLNIIRAFRCSLITHSFAEGQTLFNRVSSATGSLTCSDSAPAAGIVTTSTIDVVNVQPTQSYSL